MPPRSTCPFTRVTRADRRAHRPRARSPRGNFVATGQTLLTTLVSLDPIYVRFEGDEQAYLKRRLHARVASRDARSPVLVGLADEHGYPHEGTMVFVDNELDPATGTIRGARRSTTTTAASRPGCSRA